MLSTSTSTSSSSQQPKATDASNTGKGVTAEPSETSAQSEEHLDFHKKFLADEEYMTTLLGSPDAWNAFKLKPRVKDLLSQNPSTTESVFNEAKYELASYILLYQSSELLKGKKIDLTKSQSFYNALFASEGFANYLINNKVKLTDNMESQFGIAENLMQLMTFLLLRLMQEKQAMSHELSKLILKLIEQITPDEHESLLKV